MASAKSLSSSYLHRIRSFPNCTRKQGWRIDCRTTDGIAKLSEAPDQIETAQIDITCQDALNKLVEPIDKVGGMDVF